MTGPVVSNARHEITGLLVYRKVLDIGQGGPGLGYGGLSIPRFNVVPDQTLIYGLKIRRLSSQFLPGFSLLLNQGNLELPMRRIGEVHWFPGGYNGGIDLFMRPLERSPGAFAMPLGSRIEIEVATNLQALSLMHDDSVDPFELGEAFTSSVEQVGGAATNPQITFGPGNAPNAVDITVAKLNSLVISSNVAGLVTVTVVNNNIVGGIQAPIPKRNVVRTGGFGNFPRFGIGPNGTPAGFPVAPYAARFFVAANIPVFLPLGLELLHPQPTPLPNNGGECVNVTGPQGTATLEVTADWREQQVDP
jgi:hypothetical protein